METAYLNWLLPLLQCLHMHLVGSNSLVSFTGLENQCPLFILCLFLADMVYCYWICRKEWQLSVIPRPVHEIVFFLPKQTTFFSSQE